MFQRLDREQAAAVWKPFSDWLASRPRDFAVKAPLLIAAIPARRFWDATFWDWIPVKVVAHDNRPQAPKGNIFWAGDGEQVGQFVHGYRSAWLPAVLLTHERQRDLVDALHAATRHWAVSLHFNKGLARAPPEELAAARDTATNPAALDAFALAIIAGNSGPTFPGISGHEPNLAAARRNATSIGAMDELLKVVKEPGSYVSESDYFECDWQHAFWGVNYPRLSAAKRKYDPNNLFFVHHGVGSEEWSSDGFTKKV